MDKVHVRSRNDQLTPLPYYFILWQAQHDIVCEQCLHLVVVQNAEGVSQRSRVFNIWQLPSACKSFGVGEILMQ